MHVVTPAMRIAGLHTAFMERINVYQVPGREAALFVPSTVRLETYAWLGDVPQMEKWNDELVPRGLKESTYSILNERFGAAIKVYEDDLNDDGYGQTKERIGDMAEKGKTFPSLLISRLRANGETGICYDGSPFHSTTHQEGDSGAQSNLLAGSGVSTVDNIRTDIKAARAKFFSLKTDKGDPFARVNPRFVIVCAPGLEVTMREAAMLTTTANGGQNVYSGLISDVVVDQTLTGNDWYVEDWSPRIKPFILQEREALSLVNTALGSDMHVLQDAITFRGKWRGNAGYGLWHHSIKINN